MPNANGTESVKLDAVLVEKVRKNKEKTGIPINTFIEAAVEERLSKLKKQKK